MSTLAIVDLLSVHK